MSKRTGFWAGFVMALALHSLYQDALGRDRYIESVRVGWVSAWVSVPLALLALLLSVAWLVAADLSSRKESDV